MSQMIDLMEKFSLPDGCFSQSRLKEVHFFKSCHPIARMPFVYDPGICITAQGTKIGYLGDQVFRYDPNNYLVVSVTIPFECETIASPEQPMLGIYITIDMPQLHDLIDRLGRQGEIETETAEALPRAIGPATMDEDMIAATIRLLKALHFDRDTQILGPGLVREILFRALCGTQAPVLYALARHNGAFSQVARALALMQTNCARKFVVDALAQEARMSVSAFHRAFKAVTSESPMQYLKKIRLTRARDLMLQDNMKAYLAADQVGYESVSQFSREFKRYFGMSPADMKRAVRSNWSQPHLTIR